MKGWSDEINLRSKRKFPSELISVYWMYIEWKQVKSRKVCWARAEGYFSSASIGSSCRSLTGQGGRPRYIDKSFGPSRDWPSWVRAIRCPTTVRRTVSNLGQETRSRGTWGSEKGVGLGYITCSRPSLGDKFVETFQYPTFCGRAVPPPGDLCKRVWDSRQTFLLSL